MLECFLVFIFEKQLKSTIVYVPTIFFLIIMTIHITARKCTVSKTKTKNTEKYTTICETKSKKKNITLIAILENERLENENQAH